MMKLLSLTVVFPPLLTMLNCHICYTLFYDPFSSIVPAFPLENVYSYDKYYNLQGI